MIGRLESFVVDKDNRWFDFNVTATVGQLKPYLSADQHEKN